MTDPADPRVIAGFNPANAVPTPGVNNSTNALGNFAIPFDPATFYTSNGPKTIEIFATDNAGSVGNKVLYSFTLNDSSLPQPPPTSPPTFASTGLQMSATDVKGTIPGTYVFTGTLTSGSPAVTNISSSSLLGLAVGLVVTGTGIPAGTTIQAIDNSTGSLTLSASATASASESITAAIAEPVTNQLTPEFIGATNTGVTITVTETEKNGQGVYEPFATFTFTPSSTDGSFNFLFANSPPVSSGTFQVYVTAAYISNPNHVAPATSNTVTFLIDNTTPPKVTNLALSSADDTGIVGDNVTTDRQPNFVGNTTPGDTVELFIIGPDRNLEQDDRPFQWQLLDPVALLLEQRPDYGVRRGGRPGRQRLPAQQ